MRYEWSYEASESDAMIEMDIRSVFSRLLPNQALA